MESKTITKKKTKAEVEKDTPFIKPEDCPGALMTWIAKREDNNLIKWRDILREELKPIRRFMQLAVGNRIWLIVLSATVMVIGFILIYHLSVRL